MTVWARLTQPVRWRAMRVDRRSAMLDVFLLGGLAILVWVGASFVLRDDLFIFGDHPGHYWRMWYTLNVAWPQHHRLLDWIPAWYAGYPELQFYPPLYVLIGWALNLLTWGNLSQVLIYEIILFFAYALPGFTFYYALRHLGFDRRAAFVGGVFALIFPAIFGGASAPFIGMVGSRMAFGLNALVLVWTIDFLEARGARYAWLGASAIALAILAHPYHEIGIFIALGLYVVVRRLSWLDAGWRLGFLVAVAAGIDAFWLLPLVTNSSGNVIPLIRATFDQTWRQLVDEAFLPYMVLAVPALARLWREQDPARRAVFRVLVVLPFGLALIVLADSAWLVEQLHFYQIDPVRLLGEFYFALIFLAAIGTAELGDGLARLAKSEWARVGLAWSAPLMVCGILAAGFLSAQARYFPAPNGEPRFLSQATQDYRLHDLWQVLRETDGRVMFTSHYMRLRARGDGTWDTSLAALSPLFTQRPVIGSTYSHWSPIAAFLWVGQVNPPALFGRVEELDDQALFGVPLEKLTDAQLYANCQRLNITTLVASVDDFHTRTFLDAAPHFQSDYNNGAFFVYRVRDDASAWTEAVNAQVQVAAWADDRITLQVRAAQADASVSVKLYAYPLWQAQTDAGQILPITRDDLKMMRMALPPGENYTVTLRYAYGWAEQTGSWLSLVTLIGFCGSGVIIARNALANHA